jgi:hypothetical protein
VDVTPFHYWAFGERLRSTLELPELRPAPVGPVRWTFAVVDRLPDAVAPQLIGEDPIYGTVSAKLFRHADGHRIVVHDTGTFDIAANNHDIRWLPNADPWWDFGRSHLLGRVLATSHQLAGIVTLHGSAVETRDGVIVFLAPKEFGKSTLAAALYRAGARFVTDDALAVRLGDPPLSLPGIASPRVHAGEASAERFGVEAIGEPGRDGKLVLPPLPEERVLAVPAPLGAIYFIVPLRSDADVPLVERAVLQGVLGAVRLTGQWKIGTMLGPSHAPALLDAAVAIGRRVPMYELGIRRDLERLPEVVARLIDWHGLPTAGSAFTR